MSKRQATSALPRPARLIGYARVSTDDPVHDAQMDELRAAVIASFRSRVPGLHAPARS